MEDVSLRSIVRIGTVTDIKEDEHMARVKYQDLGITSGWLYVLQRQDCQLVIPGDGGHAHSVDGMSTSYSGGHSHGGAKTGAWMPKINDTVLCLYLPVFNGDGFVLGGIS